MTMFSRTKGGTMIHRSDCKRISGPSSRAVPWQWADTVTPDTVAHAVVTFGYRVCLYCNPIPALDPRPKPWKPNLDEGSEQ